MDKQNKIFLVIITLCTLIVVGICTWSIINHEKENDKTNISDAVKFKNEYEESNGKSNSSGSIYPTVTISENNPVKYVTEAEAVDLLENGTGVIYFGFSNCPWCRNMIGPLVTAAKEANTTLYYLDIYDIRSSYEIKDNELVKTKEGTEGYYKLLNLLDSELSDYVLKDDGKKEYITGEKRLYAPTVVAVKDGEVTKLHVGTVESQTDPYTKLSDEEINKLNKLFTELIKTTLSNTCTSTGC